MLETIYGFKQRLCYLLLKKHRIPKQCEQPVPLGQTLAAWSEEIVATKAFTTKWSSSVDKPTASATSKTYRLRVKVLCAWLLRD